MKKKLSNVSLVIAVFSFISLNSCKKEPGPGGKAHIEGEVEIEATETPVPNAKVEIWYGKTSMDGMADANMMTDKDGKFDFENMQKGDYYVGCNYPDSSGKMMSGGVAVKVDKKTGDYMADIHIE